MRKILFSALLGLAVTSSYSQVTTSDSLALVDFYNSTNGASWTNNSNWLSANPVGTWNGITANSNRVTKISLPNNGLTGSITSSIGNLTSISRIELNNNSLTGSIPDAIGNLKNLSRLFLNDNSLTGGIPDSLTTATNLSNINLSNNNLGGTLPTNFGSLTKLTTVWLINCGLTGDISAISSLNSLLQLGLNDNNFSGNIPSLSSLTNLAELYLNGNSLTGSIPSSIGSCTNLQQVWLDNNNLSSSIPTNITNLTNLLYFGASNNSLVGSLPDFTSSMPNLEWVFLENNSISSIPSLSASSSLTYLGLSNNKLNFEELSNIVPSPTSFNYSNQDTVGGTNSKTVTGGQQLVINAPDNAAGNIYQWYKDGIQLTGETNSTFFVSSTSLSDAGTYTCTMTNPSFPDLTLSSARTIVEIIGNPGSSTCGNYKIFNTIIPSSGSTFFLQLRNNAGIPANVIGLDACLSYDNSNIVPTGKIIVQSLVHNGTGSNSKRSYYFQNGQLNLSIYYSETAPSNLTFGSAGTIVSIEFQSLTNDANLSSDVSICGIDEGYANGTVNVCGSSYTTNPISALPTYTPNGSYNYKYNIRYWGQGGKKLSYDNNNPSTYIPTYVQKATNNCNTYGSAKTPNIYGNLSFQMFGNEPNFNITRDISNADCSDMSSIINSVDVDRASKIAVMDPSYVPTIQSVISADVNQDGVIRANDLTLMNRRISGALCEFPQSWNYNQDGTNSSGMDSRDWLFIGDSILSNDTDFQIDPSYPTPSGSGFSRDKIPYLDECVYGRRTNSNIIETLHAMLLGDVNGNWAQTDGSYARPTFDSQQNSNTNSKISAKLQSNPFNDFTILNVTSKSDNIYTIRISDLSGKEVYTITSQESKAFKIGNDLSNGIYILNISQSDYNESFKLLKQ